MAYFHVVLETISTTSGMKIVPISSGDEVVALAGVKLKTVGQWREGAETDGEESEICKDFRYFSCYLCDFRPLSSGF